MLIYGYFYPSSLKTSILNGQFHLLIYAENVVLGSSHYSNRLNNEFFIYIFWTVDEWMRQHKLRFLGMPRFIGSGSHEYKGEKYRFMVMQVCFIISAKICSSFQ